MTSATDADDATLWTIHGERIVDDSRRATLSIASVELPDGVQFEQYVLRVPAAAMAVVVDDQHRVLMIRRHRFILNRWVLELPGGYINDGEEPASCAAREAEEETGWRPSSVEHLVTFQPMTGTADAANHVYLARGASQVGEMDVNEASSIEWVPLVDALSLVADGRAVGAASVVGLYAARERLGIR